MTKHIMQTKIRQVKNRKKKKTFVHKKIRIAEFAHSIHKKSGKSLDRKEINV